MATDWDEVRKMRMSKERPDDWPEGVQGISMKGLGLLGVHEQSGRLYWDGRELVTITRLGTWELRWLAVVALSTLGMFCVEVGQALKWWN